MTTNGIISDNIFFYKYTWQLYTWQPCDTYTCQLYIIRNSHTWWLYGQSYAKTYDDCTDNHTLRDVHLHVFRDVLTLCSPTSLSWTSAPSPLVNCITGTSHPSHTFHFIQNHLNGVLKVQVVLNDVAWVYFWRPNPVVFPGGWAGGRVRAAPLRRHNFRVEVNPGFPRWTPRKCKVCEKAALIG